MNDLRVEEDARWEQLPADLLALAISRRAFLVTGDQHLLGVRDDLPILTPAEFVTQLRSNR